MFQNLGVSPAKKSALHFDPARNFDRPLKPAKNMSNFSVENNRKALVGKGFKPIHLLKACPVLPEVFSKFWFQNSSVALLFSQ
jgi:hypothetical protein